jgi:uncharacterized membrane protein
MWQSLFDAAGEFNASRLVLLSSWSPWLIALVAVISIAVVVLAWQNVRALNRKRRALLLGLRGAAVVALIGLFLEPGVRLENVTRVRNHVAVLVDDSRSMALPADGGGTRLDAVKKELASEEGTLAKWREQHQIDYFAVSDRARPIGGPDQLTGRGDATHLLAALEDVATRFKPQDLAAVVLLSDGADNGALGEAVHGSDEVPPVVKEAVQRLGAPVHTLFTGPKDPPKDIAIENVRYDDFAFVRNVVSIEADISVTGYDDLAIPVTLRRGDTVLGTRVLQAKDGQGTYHFQFEFVPDKVGKAVFTLEVGQGPDEKITVNNRRQFVIRIIRDKIRVLQVVGRPSWDERFLRKLLKKNPNVDLISFFILRTSTNIMIAGRDELSLIPFPTQELFEEQLGSFDLIIFQNFTYRGYQMERYLPLIRDFVANGGGFVMVGGDQSFASGGYAGTPVAEFLPVELPPQGSAQGDLIDAERFKPRPTAAGEHHPITALSLVPEDDRAIWQGLPELSGLNKVAGVRPGAQVLLEHPTLKVGDQPAPVVAEWQYKEGRVLAVMSDSTWNWDFLASTEGDNRHYYKFWGNAIRWLIKDPDLEPVRVEADRDRYPLGAEATLVTHVVGQDYQAAVDVPVKVRVERSRFDEGGHEVRELVQELTGRTNDVGEYTARVTAGDEGAYFVEATATLPGGDVKDDDVFIAQADPIEMRDTRARADTLEVLAKAGGGKAEPLSAGLDDLDRTEPRVMKVNRRKDVPLWASGWWLLVAVLLPSGEWFLRRRWGLL